MIINHKMEDYRATRNWRCHSPKLRKSQMFLHVTSYTAFISKCACNFGEAQGFGRAQFRKLETVASRLSHYDHFKPLFPAKWIISKLPVIRPKSAPRTKTPIS